MTVSCFIGLGSNVGDSRAWVRAALRALEALPDTRILQISRLVRSKPLGNLPQNDYINAVAHLETALAVEDLLGQLHRIETAHGRVREQRWGARTLDLDILLYGDAMINLPNLTIPHAGIAARNFVLYPLRELVGDAFAVPGLGRLDALIAQCSAQGMEAVED